MRGALDGVKVLDFTRVMAGPSGSQVLGDHGADIIKVELPGSRGPFKKRDGNPPTERAIWSFLGMNRNKRSLAIDLRTAHGKEVVWKLIEQADVLLENFRPGVMKRLGLDYQAVSAINSRIIYASISGFGQTGPYSERGGQDLTIQAMSGLVSMTGHREGPPAAAGTFLVDILSGLLMVQGVLLGLLARDRTGLGQYVDIAMLNGTITLQPVEITMYLSTGQIFQRGPRGSGHPDMGPIYGIYQTQDGYLALSITRGGTVFGTPLSKLCELLGLPNLEEDARFSTEEAREANEAELRAALQDGFRTKTSAEWTQILNNGGIICGPVYTFAEMSSDPQVMHQQMIVELALPTFGRYRTLGIPVKLSMTPGNFWRPPPLLGQHTDEILASLGYSPDEIAQFREEGAVA